MTNFSRISLLALALGLTPAAVLAAEAAAEPDLAALQVEVERLRGIMPGQAFAMTQIAYNFSNLWFAAQSENWPLAEFYLNETKVRLRWAMRITPVRKISSGDLDLRPIAEALEQGQLASLGTAVSAHDPAAFASAYPAVLQACQACHAASEKPFLRLQIPTAPAEPLIDFTPP